jgi:ABC-type glycerol-3-phosphate transport system permease component
MKLTLPSPGRVIAVAAVLIIFVLPPLWLLLSALKPQSEIFPVAALTLAGALHARELPEDHQPEQLQRLLHQLDDRVGQLGVPLGRDERHGRLCAREVPL